MRRLIAIIAFFLAIGMFSLDVNACEAGEPGCHDDYAPTDLILACTTGEPGCHDDYAPTDLILV